MMTVISSKVPPIEPTNMLLINQQVAPARKPIRMRMPLNTNSEYVPITVPTIGHSSHQCSAIPRPLTIPIRIKMAATHLEEVKIDVVVRNAESSALSAESIDPSSKNGEDD